MSVAVERAALETLADLERGAPRAGLRPFSLAALAGGARIYEFAEFYAAKNALLRYDARRDYLNYGYWPAGAGTPNPSAALCAAVAEAAGLRSGDVVVNIGSGLGQPDVDFVEHFGVARSVGVNVHAGQVAYANARARQAGLAHAVEHRVADACTLDRALPDIEPNRLVAIESLAEMPDLDAVLRAGFARLCPGGTIAFCDVSLRPDRRAGLLRRVLGATLARTTAALYGDAWRSTDVYVEAVRAAGFVDVAVRSIGADVYGPTFRHARRRLGGLKRVRRGATAMVVACLNLGTLHALSRLGSVDYIIVSARKAA